MVNIGTPAAFIIVFAGVVVLRRAQHDIPRPFRCPDVPFCTLLCVGSCSLLILSFQTLTHPRFLVWLIIGLAIYLTNGRKSCCRVDDASCNV
ncbi:MAG: hypothetical protein LUQ13_03885 [Methanomicrobiales archaeon]|nr:hypothetical protein [Methanomicrobiales archaeon]